MHPATEQILRYFNYDHLPANLRGVSIPFHDVAHMMARTLEGPELTVGLRKLLEAKDCCVRAALDRREPPAPAVDTATLYGQRDEPAKPKPPVLEAEPACPICGALPGETHDGTAHDEHDRRDAGQVARGKQEPAE